MHELPHGFELGPQCLQQVELGTAAGAEGAGRDLELDRGESRTSSSARSSSAGSISASSPAASGVAKGSTVLAARGAFAVSVFSAGSS